MTWDREERRRKEWLEFEKQFLQEQQTLKEKLFKERGLPLPPSGSVSTPPRHVQDVLDSSATHSRHSAIGVELFMLVMLIIVLSLVTWPLWMPRLIQFLTTFAMWWKTSVLK